MRRLSGWERAKVRSQLNLCHVALQKSGGASKIGFADAAPPPDSSDAPRDSRRIQIVYSLRVTSISANESKARLMGGAASGNHLEPPDLNLSAAVTESHAERDTHAGWTGRLDAIDTFLALLAKAVRQLHAYPVTSPVCVDAVNACRAHLAAVDGPDEISLTITPDALLVHEHAVGDGAFVRQELIRRLRRARVADLTILRECTARDLTRFCVNLLRCSETADRTLSVAAFMADDGVEAINVQITSRREVLPVAPSGPGQRDLVAHERRRREEGAQPNTRTVHLFPPHRGWIRLDPAESYDGVSLADLAILVDDPADLAAMLDRLVEENHAQGDADREDRRGLDRFHDGTCFLGAGKILTRAVGAAAAATRSWRRRRAMIAIGHPRLAGFMELEFPRRGFA